MVLLIIIGTWAILGPREIVYAGEDLMAAAGVTELKKRNFCSTLRPGRCHGKIGKVGRLCGQSCFPVLLDINGKVSYDYGIRAHPAHFLIDRQGELIGSALGAREWSSVESRNLIRFLVDQNKNGKIGRR
jgi:hypothetical protein